MNVTATDLPGVVIVEPRVYRDPRGHLLEGWNRDRYAGSGMPSSFAQHNLAFSRRGVLRGLHFQEPHGQGKLIQAVSGEIYDVAVDVRAGSPTFGRSVGVPLSAGNNRQLWVPEGFAHGFCVTSESATVLYLCTDYYAPDSEHSIRWDDPDLAIDWPVREPVLSDKDAAAPRLRDLPRNALPRYRG